MNESSARDGLSLNTRTIRSAILYLRRKYLIILIAVLLGMAFGIFYSSIKKPLYNGTVSFSLEGDEGSSGGNLLSLAAQFGLDIGGGATGIFQGDNIMELFKSRRMIETTLLLPYENSGVSFADKFLDITEWRKNYNWPTKLFPADTTQSFSRFQDSVMGLEYEYITEGLLFIEKPDIKLNIYNITFKSHNEEFTKQFVQALVTEVTNFYVTTKSNRARYNVDVLQKRTDSVRRAFDRALYGKAAIQDANLNSAFQLPMVGVEKKQTDIAVLSTAYGELLKNLELSKFALLKEVPYIQVIDVPHYPLEKRTYPWYLYVPLAMIGSFILACIALLGIKLLRRLYRMYFV